MFDDVVINVESVSKKFSRSLKHVMFYGAEDIAKNLFGLQSRSEQLRDGEFWAVNNVSFQVKRGEALGLIGPNGSGKSTLLKMLNGIFMPDKGKIEINGRVGALIEVGAGFHPMLTGRENIYVNGAILGMAKKEIDKKFDEIVDFADIGDFLDAPVKHYSSGMYVRLGFSVAVHCEPDILLVDEVLAVGDEVFQRKCFSRIHTLKQKGTAILFVSHSTSSVIELCTKALFVNYGELLLYGEPQKVVSQYHKFIYAPAERIEILQNEMRALNDRINSSLNSIIIRKSKSEEADEQVWHGASYDPELVSNSTVSYETRGAFIENPHIITLDGDMVNVLVRGEEYIYSYKVNFTEAAYSVRFGMMVKTTSGFELGGMLSHSSGNGIEYIGKDLVLRLQFKFRCIFLPGVYFINSGVVGAVNSMETFLHRGVDLVAFRVLQDTELLSGFVDISNRQLDNSPASALFDIEYLN